MISPETPVNEKERLKNLELFGVLDTLPEEDYDNLTTIASEICQTRISLVSLIDEKRQWFKSRKGLAAEETPREYAFCAHAINNPSELLIVNDARKDIRFMDNPLVTEDPYVIFYAGVPLVTNEGHALGTLCVIDKTPKKLSESQIESLKALSNQVMNLLYLRRTQTQLKRALDSLEEKNKDLEGFATLAAHDLKSPLNSISLLSNMILTEHGVKLNEEVHDWLKMISNSTGKLKQLIDDMLEHARSDNLLCEENELVAIDDFRDYFNNLFATEEFAEIEIKASVEHIEVNRNLLNKIFVNLITNAIKYNDKEIAKVSIDITDNEKEYEFQVFDNGPGIASENHDTVFQLYRVLAAKDRYGERGNGIGLATVKKLIVAQGGEIRIDPECKAGTMFIFTLKK